MEENFTKEDKDFLNDWEEYYNSLREEKEEFSEDYYDDNDNEENIEDEDDELWNY